jgi:uncharacterized protein YcbX
VQVTQLWSYPVKSMIGQRVERVDLDMLGVVGDRRWAARDLERGGIRGAKKIAGLMRLAARDLGDGDVEITLPDGSSVSTAEAGVDDRVSEAIGHPVHLEPLPSSDDLEHFRRGVPDSDDLLAEMRDIFGREEGEPLPDLGVFPPELMEFESPPGTHHDAFPLLVMTESALRALADSLPDSVIDVRRFRPSIVVEADAPGHPEFDWAGRRATIGTASIEFGVPCPRCVMVTREIDESTPVDPAVLRHVVRDLDQNVGIYATVTVPGSITVGDSLTFR